MRNTGGQVKRMPHYERLIQRGNVRNAECQY